MNTRCSGAALPHLAAAIFLFSVPACAATSDELAQMGQEASKQGRYAEAAKHFAKIVDSGASYEQLWSVKFELGWAYYMIGEYEKALPLFTDLSSVRSPSEDIRQQSLFLLAECHSRWANNILDDAKKRGEVIKKAVDLNTEFQTKFPKHPNMPESLYSRAFANFLGEQYDKATADLNTISSAYPASGVATEAQYLLAMVHSRLAKEKIKAGKKDEAKADIEKARAIFKVLTGKSDASADSANNAAFSMAETWYEMGEYRTAIPFYRDVRSRKDIMNDLAAKRENARIAVSRAVAQGQNAAQAKLALGKLDDQYSRVKGGQDMMLAAYQRIMECFTNLKRHDEARILAEHLAKFSASDMKMSAMYVKLTSLVETRNADAAVDALEEFQNAFGMNNPMVAQIPVVIAQIYVQDKEYRKALSMLQVMLDNFPDHELAEDALYLKLSAEYLLNDFESCRGSADAYVNKYPKGKYLASALYFKALAWAAVPENTEAAAASNAYANALQALNELFQKCPKPTEQFSALDEAAYQKGWILNKAGRFDEAAKHLAAFAETYKASSLLPYALFEQAKAYKELGREKEAIESLRKFARQYPGNSMAPAALYEIVVILYQKSDFEGMRQACEDVIMAFPKDPMATDSLFWIGWVNQNSQELDAAEAYFLRCFENDMTGPRAPEALLNAAICMEKRAGQMGNVSVLPQYRQDEFMNLNLDAAATYEMLMAHYPDSVQALQSVGGIAEPIWQMVRYRLWDDGKAADYFARAKARFKENIEVQARIQFAHGSYLMKMNMKDKALEAFSQALATAPAVRLHFKALIDYADTLMDAGKFEEANRIYEKVIADFPDSPDALAPAYYGMAEVKFQQNSDADARDLFNKVLTDFAWYAPGKKGKVRLAAIEEKAGNFELAEKLYTEVGIKESGEVRVAAALGVSRCQLAIAKKKSKSDPAFRALVGVADTNITKIIVLYEAFPEYVSEAKWLKATAYELVGEKQNAANTYDDLKKEYGSQKWGKQAEIQLQRLLKEGVVPLQKPAPGASAPPAKPR